MCTPVFVMCFVPDVNEIAAVPIATHALGFAGVMGPWGSPKAHVQCPQGDLATAAPRRLHHPLALWGHYAEFPQNKLTKVLGTFWSPCGRPHKAAGVAWAGVPLLNGFSRRLGHNGPDRRKVTGDDQEPMVLAGGHWERQGFRKPLG